MQEAEEGGEEEEEDLDVCAIRRLKERHKVSVH
jgi:hypothetical protein